MTDYISREAAIEGYCQADCGNGTKACAEGRCFEINFLESLPSANVRENVRGEWYFMGFQMFQCSMCKHTFTQDHLESWKAYTYEPHFPNFCPNCGAEMRGEK